MIQLVLLNFSSLLQGLTSESIDVALSPVVFSGEMNNGSMFGSQSERLRICYSKTPSRYSIWAVLQTFNAAAALSLE